MPVCGQTYGLICILEHVREGGRERGGGKKGKESERRKDTEGELQRGRERQKGGGAGERQRE